MRSLVLFLGILVATHAQAERLYFSLVEKGSVARFLNRLSTENYHIVVTRTAPPNALKSVEFESKGLELVEPFDRKAPKLKGEIANLDGIRLAAEAGHHHSPYREKIRTAETVVPFDFGEDEFLFFDEEVSKEPPDLSAIEIDPNALKASLREFSGEDPVKIGDKTLRISERRSLAGRVAARKYLAQRFSSLGYEVLEHRYSTGANFVARRSAGNSQFIVVGAHLDTVRTAGADDNGSSIVTLIELAKALKDLKLTRYDLTIVGFDEEESGLIGSAYYVEHLKKTGEIGRLAFMINLEMTGYDANADGKIHVIDCKEGSSPAISERFLEVVKKGKINLTRSPACTNRSDHQNFWKAGKPAIVISQDFFGGDGNPCYHRRCDRVNRLDFNYMARIATALTRTVGEMVSSK